MVGPRESEGAVEAWIGIWTVDSVWLFAAELARRCVGDDDSATGMESVESRSSPSSRSFSAFCAASELTLNSVCSVSRFCLLRVGFFVFAFRSVRGHVEEVDLAASYIISWR